MGNMHKELSRTQSKELSIHLWYTDKWNKIINFDQDSKPTVKVVTNDEVNSVK